jgi:hypothetical protein
MIYFFAGLIKGLPPVGQHEPTRVSYTAGLTATQAEPEACDRTRRPPREKETLGQTGPVRGGRTAPGRTGTGRRPPKPSKAPGRAPRGWPFAGYVGPSHALVHRARGGGDWLAGTREAPLKTCKRGFAKLLQVLRALPGPRWGGTRAGGPRTRPSRPGWGRGLRLRAAR